MPPKKRPPAKRNAWDFIHRDTKRGEVLSCTVLSPEYVTELRDNPNDFTNPIEVGRILPGTRVALRLSGCPFEFVLRVALDQSGTPRVVDLRMRSPAALGDVAITNADLKEVPIAALAAEALKPSIPGVHAAEDAEPVGGTIARPPGRPTNLTDDFLRAVTRFARRAFGDEKRPEINTYVAAAMKEAGWVDFDANVQTVRGWRKAATARRRQSPDDDSFLRSGELRGKPGKDTAQ